MKLMDAKLGQRLKYKNVEAVVCDIDTKHVTVLIRKVKDKEEIINWHSCDIPTHLPQDDIYYFLYSTGEKEERIGQWKINNKKLLVRDVL